MDFFYRFSCEGVSLRARIRLLMIQCHVSVKKGLVRPPSAVPSTIMDEDVRPGQVRPLHPACPPHFSRHLIAHRLHKKL
jgi:hypothetical protein